MNNMEGNSEAFSQIGSTLANHFDCVYYVDVKTGKYHEYVHMDSLDKLGIPQSGIDGFMKMEKIEAAIPDERKRMLVTFTCR